MDVLGEKEEGRCVCWMMMGEKGKRQMEEGALHDFCWLARQEATNPGARTTSPQLFLHASTGFELLPEDPCFVRHMNLDYRVCTSTVSTVSTVLLCQCVRVSALLAWFAWFATFQVPVPVEYLFLYLYLYPYLVAGA